MCSKNESKFWGSVLGGLSTGWKLEVAPHEADGAAPLSSTNCFVYGMDVATGWCVVGGIQSADLEAFDRFVSSRTNSTRVEDVAADSVVRCSQHRSTLSAEETESAIQALAAALYRSDLFATIADMTEGGQGHWLYLVYTGKDGRLMARPAYLGRGERMLKSLDAVFEQAKKVIEFDLQDGSSDIGQKVAECGGAEVATHLKDPINQAAVR